MGSLLSGISFAKGIAHALNIPIVPINLMEKGLLDIDSVSAGSPTPEDSLVDVPDSETCETYLEVTL